MLTIYTISTPNGIYITDCPQSKSYDRTHLKGLVVNGEPLTPTFHPHWFIVNGIPCTVQELCLSYVNKRFELDDPETFPNLPKYVSYDEVYVGVDYDDYDYFTDEFEKIKSLFTLKSDKEESFVDLEFELVQLAEVDFVPGIVPFSYKISDVNVITEKSVKYPILTQITTPTILHPTTSCYLSSKETYDIIRTHVKQNIDLNVAKISSDFGFCFSVVKLIELYKPEEYKVDVNALYSRRKPKYETRFRKHREIQVFEMTHDEKCYKGYTPIKGFSADSQPELAEKIELYLANLMMEINEPLADCPHCKGLGVVVK